jgi:hypothetical protein
MKHRHFTGVNYQSEIAQIANGQMNVFAGYEWNSWLEALQTPLVFLGIWPIGVRDARFSYGRPWVWEAALVMDVLRRHHQEIPLTRSQIIDIFRDSLEQKKVPLRRLLVVIMKVRLLSF